MLHWFKKLRPGDRVSAEDYNRLVDQVTASANLSVSPPLLMNASMAGNTIGIDMPVPKLCRVQAVTTTTTDKLPAYTVLPVYEQIIVNNATPFFRDSPEPTMTAYEISSNPYVPVDGTALVWCYLSETNNEWLFSYESRVIFAEITGCPSEVLYHYPWVEKRRTSLGAWEDMPNGYSGTSTFNPLVEMNGRGGTPIGTIVFAHRGYSQGRGWVNVIQTARPGPSSTYTVQSVTIYNAVGGVFALAFNDNVTTETTADIAYDCTAAVLRAALEALTNIGAGNVTVTGAGTAGNPFLVTFTKSTALYPLMAVDYTDLYSSQEWLFQQPITHIKARIMARTEAACGNSGSSVRSGTELSGSNATDHTIYTYSLHSVHAVNDGDGCPTFVNDDLETAVVIDEAYEQNNNIVAVGTVVDAQAVAYNDESASGSEDGSGSDVYGPPGCRWVFNHSAAPVDSQCFSEKSITHTKMSCDGTHWVIHTYEVTFGVGEDGCYGPSDPILIGSFTTTSCCEPCSDDSGSNSGTWPSSLCDSACQETYCITFALPGVPEYCNCNVAQNTSFCAGIDGLTVELAVSSCGDPSFGQTDSYWTGTTSYTQETYASGTWTTQVHVTLRRVCATNGAGNDTFKWYVRAKRYSYVGTGGNNGAITCSEFLIAGDVGEWLYLGEGTDANTPPTVSGSITCETICYENPYNESFTGTWALAVGGCTYESGSSSGSDAAGDCPCQWMCVSSAWTLIYGDSLACSAHPPGGSFVCSPNGSIFNANTDGTACDPDEGVSGDCSACSYENAEVATTVTSAATGFLAGISNPSMTYEDSGTPHFADGTGQATTCGQLGFMHLWCEGGEWMMTFRGTGQAFRATSGDCTTATFDLAFTTNNTLCPGQSGSIHVVVTLP